MPEETEIYGAKAFAETPFADPRLREQEELLRESLGYETFTRDFEFTTPFLPGESTEAGEAEAATPEVAAFSFVPAT
jgi:hypothetical protein